MVLTVSPGNARRRHRSSGGQNANERPHDVSPRPANLICSRHLPQTRAARLLAHSWPGNVRELLNAMKRAATLVRRPIISASDLDFLAVRPGNDAPAPNPMDWLAGTLPEAVERVEVAMTRALIAGGPAPLIATALFAAYHTGYAIAIYIAACADKRDLSGSHAGLYRQGQLG